MATRGIRNNNPGNLILTTIGWQGKIPFPQNTDGKFEQFATMEYGIRAMLKDLINDIGKGKNTVRKLIHEYAPAFENNTTAYINSVAKSLGVAPDAKLTRINGAFLLLLARAIIKVENGSDHTKITDSTIKKAIKMLGDASTPKVEVDTSDIKRLSFLAIVPVLLFFYTYLTIII